MSEQYRLQRIKETTLTQVDLGGCFKLVAPDDFDFLLEQARKGVLNLVDCQVCEGSGFSGAGTGYDSVCDMCGGQGEYPG